MLPSPYLRQSYVKLFSSCWDLFAFGVASVEKRARSVAWVASV